MKRGLFIMVVFLVAGMAQVAVAAEGQRPPLPNTGGDRASLEQDALNTIVLPAPFKVVAPRRIDIGSINPVMERQIDRKTLIKELKKKGRRKTGPQRGPVSGKSLTRDSTYFPPSEKTTGTSFLGTLRRKR